MRSQFVAGLAFSLFVGNSFAASFSANASADAFATTGPVGEFSNSNFGADPAIAVSASRSGQPEFQSVLQFDTRPFVAAFDAEYGPGAWRVETASLRLTFTSGGHPLFNNPSVGSFGVGWMQNDSWVEGSGTARTPGSAGITLSTLKSTFLSPADENLGTFPYTFETTGRKSYVLQPSPAFTADLLSGGLVSLRLFEDSGNVSTVFSSREFGIAADRPTLTIQAVPEPATLAIFGLGIVALTLGGVSEIGAKNCFSAQTEKGSARRR